MLVLTRKPNQSLYIGDNIKITVHGIRGNQVKLGIDAPDSIRVYREEIYIQILQENLSAAAQNMQASAGQTPSDLSGIAKAWADGRSETLIVFKKNTKKPKPLPESELDDEEDDNFGNK